MSDQAAWAAEEVGENGPKGHQVAKPQGSGARNLLVHLPPRLLLRACTRLSKSITPKGPCRCTVDIMAFKGFLHHDLWGTRKGAVYGLLS